MDNIITLRRMGKKTKATLRDSVLTVYCKAKIKKNRNCTQILKEVTD